MKKCYIAVCFCFLVILVKAQTGNWTWESGDNVSNTPAVYGTKGATSAKNKPGSRASSVSWKDASGNFWLFGGNGLDAKNSGYLNDLWRYNPPTSDWTWVSGDSAVNKSGLYGSKGTANLQNKPGGRSGAISWTDAAGNFWLFGGEGYDIQNNFGLLNDLWKYNPAANTWTWISGNNFTNQGGAYGVKNVAIPSNRPGARSGSVSWIDASGFLWLYGGLGYDSTATGYLGDLWKFNPSNALWTWVSGDNNANSTASFGTKGNASATNKPGSRMNAVSWYDAKGVCWLFGGYSKYQNGLLNDLWKFDPASGQWTWVSGDNTAGINSVYGTRGITAGTNKPGSRQSAISWKDASGNFWLFGGQVYYNTTFNSSGNDLWKYDVTANQWTWISGDNIPGQAAVYGTKGITASTNKPGAWWGAVSWIDGAGSLWQFGGMSFAAEFYLQFNHLWKFDPVSLSCPSSVTMATDSDKCTAIVKNIDPVFGANGNASVLYSIFGATTANSKGSVSGTSFYKGLSTVVYKLAADTQQSCRFTVTVVDKTPPSLRVSNLPALNGECSVTVTSRPTATDNCGEVITATTSDRLFYSGQGTYTINWSYRDSSGNTNSQQQQVVIKNLTPPLPDMGSLPTVIGDCSVLITSRPTATDHCGNKITGATTNSLAYHSKGIFTINWTYTDSSGNITTQPQQVVIKDTTPPSPVVKALPGLTVDCSSVITPPTAIDNCNGTITGITASPISFSGDGAYTITWLYKDSSGNTSSQLQQVTVKDQTPPVPTLQSLPDLSAECSVTITKPPTAFDNCSGTIIGTTTNSLLYNTQGNFTITWTYKDSSGNSTIQQQRVIIKDHTAPVPDMASLPDITGDCSITISTTPTASDNCNGSVKGTTSDSLSYAKQGSYIINWIYKDAVGNTSTQQQHVVVKDNTPPVPNVASLPDITGDCSATISVAPTATDNCSGTITGITSDPLAYDLQGSYTVNWTYKDANGNTTIQQQQVIIRDHTPPVPDLANLPDILGECSASVMTPPTASDNCSGKIVGITADKQSYDVQGTYNITWTFKDSNGNTVTQQQKVIVKDQTAPVPNMAILPTITGECSAAVTITPAATDNCSGVINATTADPLSYNTTGSYTINWTYTDKNGNTTIQKQQVVIKTTVGPAPSLAVLPEITGECAATVSTKPTAKDRCGNIITATTTDPLTYTIVGKHIISWKYTDASGNITIQKQIVTVITLDLTLNLFPNPTNNEFQILIKSCDNSRIITLYVFDMMGRTVYLDNTIKPYESNRFGSGFPGGTYIVMVTQGSQRVNRKVIKVK